MSDNQFVDLSEVTNRTKPNRNDNVWLKSDNVPQQKIESFATGDQTLETSYADVKGYQSYPTDDALSLHQIADNGNIDLNVYGNPFYQNETYQHQGVGAGALLHGLTNCYYLMEHTPILAGTMTGSIARHAEAEFGQSAGSIWQNVQTFVVSMDGQINFQDIGDPEIKAIGGSLNLQTGELTLIWDADPAIHRIVVSYEGSMEVQEQELAVGQQGKWTIFNQSKDQNNNSYIDYLVNQLAETKSRLVDAEDKLNAIHKSNNDQKTLAELEVDMYNDYDKRLKQMKEYFVSKIDQFLTAKMGTEEDARKTAARPPIEIFEEAIGDETSNVVGMRS